jgi:type II secretory pathway predicted ATPase ExeA
MYESFYGLSERPFDLTPNPRFLFLTAGQREALGNLRYGLTTPRGLTLLLGDAGTGKTTLVHAALEGLASARVTGVLLSNPTLTRGEFYETLADSLGLSAVAAESKAKFLVELRHLLSRRLSAGELSAVVFDEAQSLPDELLEEVRLLSNMETTTEKLINVVLAGQPELADRLNKSSLRQLKQRISLRCELKPLSLHETAAYIAGRLRIAGGTPAGIFTRAAVAAVYHGSFGVPRTVNVICDNALIGGFAAQVRPVSARIVEEVLRDFSLSTGWETLDTMQDELRWVGYEEEDESEDENQNQDGNEGENVNENKDGSENVAPPPDAADKAGRIAAASDRMFEIYKRKGRFSFFKVNLG